MLTAKVNTVNFYCGVSLNAFCIELVIIQLYLYVVTVTNLDLALSFVLLGYLSKVALSRSLLKPKCSGYVMYSPRGDWKEQNIVSTVHAVHTSLSHWFLMIVLCNGQVRLLWRDSCRDEVYRDLIVKEKQRRYTSAGKPVN